MKEWLITGLVILGMAIIFSMPKSDLYSLLGLMVVNIIIFGGIKALKSSFPRKNN